MPTRHVIRIANPAASPSLAWSADDAVSILDENFPHVVDGKSLAAAANDDDTNEEDEVRNAKAAHTSMMDPIISHETKTAASTRQWRSPRREDFESVLDYLEAKYVNCIMIAVENEDIEQGGSHPSHNEGQVSSTEAKSHRSDTMKMKGNDAKNGKKLTKDSSGINSSFVSPIVKMNGRRICIHHSGCMKQTQGGSKFCWTHGAKEENCHIRGCRKKCIQFGLCENHGGLVQLCQRKGCINEVNWERSAFCYLHGGKCFSRHHGKEGEEIQLCSFRGCISESTDGGLCDMHSSSITDNERGKKRSA
jgi:hypothetical protein